MSTSATKTNGAAGFKLVSMKVEDLAEATKQLLADGGRMQMAYAWYPSRGRIELRYVASQGGSDDFVVWRVRPQDSIPSLAGISPLLSWYEREITDLFGLQFDNQPDPNPLVLQEGAAPELPPFDPKYPAGTPMPFKRAANVVPELDSPEVQRLPFGPVRADVVESGEFIFFYVGEHILHFHPRLFFKHRGMEKRFEGKTIEAGTILAERVSGVGSIAHGLAYCQAVECAAGCPVPQRALLLRTLLAELERLYNHLHYLGHLADTTTLKVGNAQGKFLEERAKQINSRLTGSRFLRNVLTPGGLRRDLSPEPWLAEALAHLRKDIAVYTEMLDSTNSYLDRLITTGRLSHRVAFDQGATGPIERASGLDRDLRRDHPYAAYRDVPPSVTVKTEGDAHARAQVRTAEIDASIRLLQRILSLLKPGDVFADCDPEPGSEGLAWTESPRGSLFYAVHFDKAGRLGRVKIKSPSFSNWRVFPFTVHESNIMDYAINEASFGLTIAGCDR